MCEFSKFCETLLNDRQIGVQVAFYGDVYAIFIHSNQFFSIGLDPIDSALRYFEFST